MKKKIIFTAALCALAGNMFLAQRKQAAAEGTYDYIVTEAGVGVNGSDTSSDAGGIQAVLNRIAGATREMTVYVPGGTYYIDRPLRIYSNTHLILDAEAVMYRMDDAVDGELLHNVDQNGHMDEIGGYDMSENITIEGGTWDGGQLELAETSADLIRFDHARNIVVKDCVIKNVCGAHLLEYVGIQNGLIQGCTLQGFRYQPGHEGELSYGREAIQLESAWTNNPSDTTQTSALWANGSVVDGTSCENVTVTDNKVLDFPCGIGQHHYTESGEYRNSNIVIKNNRIVETSGKFQCKTAITCGGMNHVVISGNTVQGDYRFGIHVIEADDIDIQKNMIRSCTVNGIMVDSGRVNAISGNTLSDVKKHGISIGGGSVRAISKNIIKKMGTDGISIDDGTVTLVKGNTLQNIKKHGISITGGVAGTGRKRTNGIQKNTIKNCGQNGITVSGKAKVSCANGNGISGIKNNGISVTDHGVVYWITKNTIRKCKRHGIWNGSSVKKAKSKGNRGIIK